MIKKDYYSEQEILDLANSYFNEDGSVNTSLRISYLFSTNNFLRSFLNERYPGLKTTEQLWLLTGHEPQKCKICGKPSKFTGLKIINGKSYLKYNDCCSKECRILQIKEDIKSGKRSSFTKEDGISVKERYIRKYGEIEGIKKWEEWKFKQKTIFNNKSEEDKEKQRKQLKEARKLGIQKLKGVPKLTTYINKYGEELGPIKYQEDKENQRKVMKEKFSGINNPQYGKPASHSSGKGWRGWYYSKYNGKIFFRSLLELSFIINVLEANNIKWETGEKKEYKIPYPHKDKIRNYFPDFILDKFIIEIKPFKLLETSQNKSKKQEGIKKAKELNKEYIVFTERNFKGLLFDEVKELVNNKQIEFDKKTLEKYEKVLEDDSLRRRTFYKKDNKDIDESLISYII